jgi:hypothetical protein
MIQRIQTIFLLISSILSVAMIFFPLSEMQLANNELLKLYSVGVKNMDQAGQIIYYTLPLLFLLLVITIISTISIFFYKKRELQMKLCVYNILLMILLLGLMIFYYLSIKHRFLLGFHSFSIIAISPFVNIILTFQAFRAIRRDELLIKTYDRLR